YSANIRSVDILDREFRSRWLFDVQSVTYLTACKVETLKNKISSAAKDVKSVRVLTSIASGVSVNIVGVIVGKKHFFDSSCWYGKFKISEVEKKLWWYNRKIRFSRIGPYQCRDCYIGDLIFSKEL
ncbi:hypothetical protein HMI54_001465, partial [Coelomomyces lativittatus]